MKQRTGLAARLAPWKARWNALGTRDQRLVLLAATLVVLAGVWTLSLRPAWQTLREAPAQLEHLETQLQQMQRLASEAQQWRGATALAPGQAQASLKAASERLGTGARLSLQGDRAVLALDGVSGAALRAWLVEVRSGARARPVEAQLTRSAQGFSGTVTLSLGNPP